MAYSRFLLLLLIGALSSHFPEAEARPVDFWCNPGIRQNWRENAEVIINKMQVDCQGTSDAQAIPCPYVGFNTERWNNLTVLERFADVMRDLQVFHDGLEEFKNQTAGKCQSHLHDIQQHIRNNRLILQHQIQNATVEASSPPQTCTGLTAVLRRYEKLLQGKLEQFVKSFKDSNCTQQST